MIVAELEVFHSRPIAPTRRIALGQRNLPTDPAPGAGGLLLAGILAEMAPGVAPDLREHLYILLEDIAAAKRIPQPRVRHRFQTDTVGLLRTSHRLVATEGELAFEFDHVDRGLPVQHALAALYAAGQLQEEAQEVVFDAMRAALVWGQAVDGRFISAVIGGGGSTLSELRSWNDPIAWALDVMGLDANPTKRTVMKRFRGLVRQAHPDHGAEEHEAAVRLAELSQARDLLL